MKNNNNKERSVILSAVRSYDFDCLQPFLISLDRVGYTGEICFFVDDVTERTINKLKEAGVIVIPFKSLQFTIPFRNRKIYYYKVINEFVNFLFYGKSPLPDSGSDLPGSYFLSLDLSTCFY